MKEFVFKNKDTGEERVIQMEDGFELVIEDRVVLEVRTNKVWFQLFQLPDGSKVQAKEGSNKYLDFVGLGYHFASERYYLEN